MLDKSALEISEELRQFIEEIVKEVVLEEKSFENQNHMKYLLHFCQAESIDYETLVKNLTDFFEIIKEWKSFQTKASSMMAKMLSGNCYLSEAFVDQLFVEIEIKKIGKEQEAAEEEKKRQQEKRKAEKAKQEAERKAQEEADRKSREDAERKAREGAERQAKEEQERRAKLIANNQKKLEEQIFNDFPNVKKELMGITALDNFYVDYYAGYRLYLSKLKEASDKIIQLLNDVDSRQSAEYSNYSTEANQYIERVKKAHAQWEEIKAMVDEGEVILRKGQRLRGTVIRNREEAERKSRVRKKRLIAAFWTIIFLVFVFTLCWWLFFSPNQDKVKNVDNPTSTIDSDPPSSPETDHSAIHNDPIVAIDLGLPSGTKWANCNVGATKPWEYGGYYAWGETEEKTEYWDDSYKYYSSYFWGLFTTYHDLGNSISGTKYDVAHIKWGGKWKMPMMEQVKELMEICKWEWTTLNGVEGCKFTGPNGNNIFLPAAGKRVFTELYTLGNDGDYWSDVPDRDGFAHSLDITKDGKYWSRWPRSYGLSVRPVAK